VLHHRLPCARTLAHRHRLALPRRCRRGSALLPLLSFKLPLHPTANILLPRSWTQGSTSSTRNQKRLRARPTTEIGGGRGGTCCCSSCCACFSLCAFSCNRCSADLRFCGMGRAFSPPCSPSSDSGLALRTFSPAASLASSPPSLDPSPSLASHLRYLFTCRHRRCMLSGTTQAPSHANVPSYAPIFTGTRLMKRPSKAPLSDMPADHSHFHSPRFQAPSLPPPPMLLHR
jgi:hypothetical protein